MRRRGFLKAALGSGAALVSQGAALRATTASPEAQAASPQSASLAVLSRAEWLGYMRRVAAPVLEAAAAGRLHVVMPVETAPGQQASRRKVTYLEAVGRTLAGVSAWLELHPIDAAEVALCDRFRNWAQAAVITGVDPRSPGYLRFGVEAQTVVDAGFLALAMARAPNLLVRGLPSAARKQLAAALRATRACRVPFNNWLLFAALVEAALRQLDEEWDRERVDYALREMAAWYLGDGTYGDGPHFHADYYNSFVMHPFLLALLEAVGEERPEWRALLAPVRARATRYAMLQERSIGPDGSYPPLGRSLTYRCGAFHLLADVSLRGMLPEGLQPAAVRGALGAAIQRTLDPVGTFDPAGWLQIGVAGHQPELGETYISTGSLYLCTAALLPLGLPAGDRFWTDPPAPWTAQLLWSGGNAPIDHALDEETKRS